MRQPPPSVRDRVDMPWPTRLTIVGMVVVALYFGGFMALAAAPSLGEWSGLVVVLTLVAVLIFAFVPALAAWGVWRGHKFAPILVTIVAAFQGFRVLAIYDLASVLCGIAAIVAGIAVWMPSARRYAAAVRARPVSVRPRF